MKQKIRVFKLDKLDDSIPSGAYMSVAEYAKKQTPPVTVSAIYNKIYKVLNGEGAWDDFVAYCKGENVCIVANGMDIPIASTIRHAAEYLKTLPTKTKPTQNNEKSKKSKSSKRRKPHHHNVRRAS